MLQSLCSMFHSDYNTSFYPLNYYPIPLNEFEISPPSKDIDCILIAVSKLKPTNSCGPDGTPPFIFKSCYLELAYPLPQIFKLSIQCGYLPPAWK